MRSKQPIARDHIHRNGKSGGRSLPRRAFARSRQLGTLAFHGVLAAALAWHPLQAVASNPFSLIGETFSDWKDRLFGKSVAVADAAAEGPIALQPGHPLRLRLDKAAPERDFPKGKSRYRIVELPADLEHAALRVQVTALSRDGAFGHEVFKPFVYPLNDDDSVRDPIEVKPLHLDIRPFRRTRLLGCVTLDKVHRFALGTSAEVVGKSYESEVREAIKAPTQGGFYYATDAVKVKLPWAATGELILEVTSEPAAGKGC